MLPWLPDTPAARVDLAQYYSNVRNIDSFVGEMMKKLKASGQADRTVVVFTGDHGIPVQRGKTSIYPAGTQVPCYITGPQVKVGRVISTPISQLDFNPTFLEAVGAQPAAVCHGTSLWPILRGETDVIADRQTIMTETNNSFMSSPVGGDKTMARAVCDGRYYYIRNLLQDTSSGPAGKFVFLGSGHGEYGDPGPQYANNLHDETVLQKETQPLPFELLRQLCMSDAPPEELYDLDADPWGVHNLVDASEHTEALTRLQLEFKHWREVTGDVDVHPAKIARRTERRVP